MAKKPRKQQGWSVMAVTLCAAFVVAVLTWMCAASAFATDRFYAEVAAAEAAGEDRPDNQMFEMPRRRRTAAAVFGFRIVVEFFKNAIVEIPHAPQVVWHALTQRLVIPIGFVVAELLVLGGASRT